MIISFYSYKGGVGRTQLVANLATYLCHHKKRKLLLIDWDIEAPGLDYFFKLNRKNISKGIIELFEEYTTAVSQKESNLNIDDLPLISNDYLIPLVHNNNNIKEGQIDFLAAGNYNSDYQKKISDFDWYRFYETLNGKYYIENFKEQLRDLNYDYIFIDSRTGLNDYSGICNIQMPEMNVIVVAPSEQNFDGCLNVIQNIHNSPYVKNGLREPIIMPILSRLDRTDDGSGDWFASFRKRYNECILKFASYANLGRKIPESSQKRVVNEFIENTLMPYKSKISYGEKLLFSKKIKSIEYTTLEKQFEEIAKLIEDISGNDKKSIFIGSSINIPNVIISGDSNVVQSNISVTPDIESKKYIDNIITTLKILNEDVEYEVKSDSGKREFTLEIDMLIKSLKQVKNQDNVNEEAIKLPLKRLSLFLEDIQNTQTGASLIISKTKRGLTYFKEIAQYYNSIAQWTGLPMVPEFFIKRK